MAFVLKEQVVSEELIRLYPNSIVKDEYGNVDFEESVFDISYKVKYKMSATKQKKLFGEEFETQEDAYDFIIKNLGSLHEMMIEKYEKL